MYIFMSLDCDESKKEREAKCVPLLGIRKSIIITFHLLHFIYFLFNVYFIVIFIYFYHFLILHIWQINNDIAEFFIDLN